MAPNFRAWIACTPVAFRGDNRTFFCRDSGLCCRTLQSLGAEAKVIMPEPAWDDEPDVFRVPYKRLRSRDFWRAQEADAVILYSWADPRYTSIAQAIRAGGKRLCLNVDTHGLFSPFVEPATYLGYVCGSERQKRGAVTALLAALCRWGWQSIGFRKHILRLRHMAAADVIAAVSPIAAERIRRYARCFGRVDIERKVHVIPHPIDPVMRYAGGAKHERVIAVGRWTDPVKRREVMTAVAATVVSRHPTVEFVLVGNEATRWAAAIAEMVPSAQKRVSGYEQLPHDRLREEMNLAQVSLCTSRSESFHAVSGEALLCGCTVVGPRSPLQPALDYFVANGTSGRLAGNTPSALSEAVLLELGAWREGRRDPAAIAHSWRGLISADSVVMQIDKLLANTSTERRPQT